MTTCFRVCPDIHPCGKGSATVTRSGSLSCSQGFCTSCFQPYSPEYPSKRCRRTKPTRSALGRRCSAPHHAFVLVCHMWRVKWLSISVSPDLLAGLAYYICDSHILRDFTQRWIPSKRQRDLRVSRMQRRYRFGWIKCVSGRWRIGIDYAEGA